MIPLLLWILSPHFMWQGHGEQEIVASVLFVLASITDGVDGYLARKRGQNPDVVKVWIAVVIIGREFLISGLRSIAASEGFTIQASDLGKLKTVIQIVSVVSAILAHHWFQWSIGWLIIPVKWTAVTAIYFTVGVSTISDRLFRGLLEEDRSRIEGPPEIVCADAAQECGDDQHELKLRPRGLRHPVQ